MSRMIKTCLALGLAGLVLISSSAAYANAPMTQDEWEALSYATALLAMQHAPPTVVSGAGHRFGSPWIDVTTPAVVGGYIVTTLKQSGTPCFNCVNSGEAGTYGTGDPLGYVNSTLSSIGVLNVYFDVSDTASCSISIALTQGTTVLASGSGHFTPTPGAVEWSFLSVTRQSTWHGAALMTGKVTCGSVISKDKGTVWFQ